MLSMKQMFRPLLLSMVIAIAIYLFSAIFNDLDVVGEAMSRLGVTGWVLILALSLINYGLRFVRWQGYLRHLGYRVPVGMSAAYYLAGFAFTTTPGKAGEAVRSLYLKRHGVSYAHSLAMLFAERFIDLVAIILLALSAAWAFPQAHWPVAILILTIIVTISLLHVKQLQDGLRVIQQRLHNKHIQVASGRLLSLLRSASTLLKSTPLYTGLVVGVVAWGAEGLAFHVILDSLEFSVGLGLEVGIYAAGILIGALSFIPGGLGSTEATMVLLLTAIGMDTPSAVAATLICRLATLWFAVAIGLLVMGILELLGDRLSKKSTTSTELGS